MIHNLDQFDDDLTIYAEKRPDWTPESEARVAAEGEGDSLPYFLEVGLAKEAIRVWSEWREGREASPDERFEAARYYAIHDAYLQSAKPS